MVEFFVHIHNSKEFLDPEVLIKVQRPIVPRKEDYFDLSDKENKELVRQVLKKNKLEYYENGYNDYEVDEDELMKMDINQVVEHLSFNNKWLAVRCVAIYANGEIHIELFDGWNLR